MELKFIAIKNGMLAIGHRPKIKDILELKKQGVTTIVTILGENENPTKILSEIKKQHLKSIHIPVGKAKPIEDTDKINEILEYLKIIKECLLKEETIYIHCSAGIHRTGMYTNALLLLCGYLPKQAFSILGKLRKVTQENVGEDRLNWGLVLL